MSPYSVLGVDPSASVAEIRRAFRVRAKELHPDRGGDVDAFRALCEAYDQVGKPKQQNSAKDLGARMRENMEAQRQATQKAAPSKDKNKSGWFKRRSRVSA